MKNIVMIISCFEIDTDMNMHYIHRFKFCQYLTTDKIIASATEDAYKEITSSMSEGDINGWILFESHGRLSFTKVWVRNDYLETFQKYRKRGRTYSHIMRLMKQEL
ncbi:MAG: hypothetical protein ACI4F4_07010 [Lachnospiraceae bacterium]